MIMVTRVMLIPEWMAGARKKQLHIEKGDDDFIPGRGGGYDDPDEYDFM